MQGVCIKVTGPDGRSWTVPFQGAQLTVGRTADNDVVLEQGGVSSHHCVVGRDPMGTFVIQDRGSTNGTWIGGARIQGSSALQLGAVVAVGEYMLELSLGGAVGAAMTAPPKPLTGAAPVVRHSTLGMPAVGSTGPLIRKSEDEHQSRRFHDRIARYAKDWDKNGRPNRLLLRPRNLSKALAQLELETDVSEPFGELEESFIRASKEHGERLKIVRLVGGVAGGLALVGALAFLVTRDWSEDVDEVEVAGEAGDEGEAKAEDEGGVEELKELDNSVDVEMRAEKAELIHKVIPAETLEEIALRYGVSIKDIGRWNGVDESTQLEPGRELMIRTDKNPLAQQQVTYRPDKRESWSSLAKRFDVPVAKLEAYNPHIEDTIKKGMELAIWVDPKPLEKREHVKIPEFTVRPDAISIGAPQDGKIDNAIQFPKNDDLYKRRNPQIMWCASHMAQNLQWAIAKFRYTYNFEGEMVVADMSKQRGGKFDPHKSHQAGRDVDIWLPSLKGVYQPHHIHEGKERRPTSEEADWFALYGFLKALHETKSVEAVFLAYELHDRVYKAAKLMGASDEELDEMIAFPRGAHHRQSLLQHSPGHTHHVHVRFKCGPNDQCSKSSDNSPGD